MTDAAHPNKSLIPSKVPIAYADQRKVVAPTRYAVIDMEANKITAIPVSSGFSLVGQTTQSKFERLVKAWKKDTAHLSLTKQQTSSKWFMAILILGLPALPLIFEEFARDPISGWIPALEVMTEENPAIEAKSYRETVQLWIAWGRNNGYLR